MTQDLVPTRRSIRTLGWALGIALFISTTWLARPGAAQLIPLSGEFQANQDTVLCPQNPRVLARADGGFAVIWADQHVQSIRGRFYDVNGIAQGGEQTLQSETGIFFEDVVGSQDGTMILAWSINGEGSQQMRGRRFSSTGAGLGSDFEISSVVADVRDADLAMDDQGDFVVVWTEGVYPSYALQARRFASDGTPQAAPFPVTSQTNALAGDVAKDADSGEFVVVWQGGSPSIDVWAEKYDFSGSSVGSEFVVNAYTTDFQGRPSVALSTTGEMLVNWRGQTANSLGNSHSMLSFLDANGSSSGEVHVGDPTTAQIDTEMAATAELGSFVVGMEEISGGIPFGPVSGSDVRGAFNLFFDQQITSTEAGDQRDSAVAIDPADRATFVWLTDPDDNACFDVMGVRAQLYRILEAGETSAKIHGPSAQVAWKQYSFAPPAAGGYEIRLKDMTGDVDLYVRAGGVPSISEFDCRPFIGGLGEEVCYVTYTGTPFGIGVNGFDPGTSMFTILAVPETPLFADGFESGDTSAWSATVN